MKLTSLHGVVAHWLFGTCLAATWGSLIARADGAEEAPWTVIAVDESFSAWRDRHRGWSIAGGAELSGDGERRLSGADGTGVLVSRGDSNLYTREEFQDVELKLEFMVPRGSNAGVKLNGLYEIQIRDSYGKEEWTADDNGGVYPRAEHEPSYRFLDDGYPALVNASRPAGEWQTLELVFIAPRFDDEGEKTKTGRFLNVVLNGETIHEDVELKWPTGAAWDMSEEVPRGPLMLQGDHGPVAFRNIAIRPAVGQ
jgi:hypothetical protein